MDGRRWILLIGSIAVGAMVFLFLRREPCASAEQKLRTVWDASRRAELQKSFAANRGALEAVEAAFETFVSRWSTDWDQTCADKSSSTQVLARKRVCLDGRLAQLAALSELFSQADSAVVSNARVSIERLSAFGPCNDAIAEVPLRSRAEIALAQRKIARSDVLRRAGRHPDALSAANEAIVLAQAAKYAPVLAEALLARADDQRAGGKLEDAERSLDDAQRVAEAGRDFETLTRICISHLVLLGSQPRRAQRADDWVKCADDALKKFPQPALRADLDLAIAVLRMEQGRPAESEVAARRALEGFSKNAQPARTLDATGLLAQALSAQGKLEAAIPLAQRALDGRLALLGDSHPQTLRARLLLAETLLKANRAEQTLATFESLTEPQLSALPPATAAAVLCCRGKARTLLRDVQGLEDVKRCDALLSQTLGEDHPSTGPAHDAVAAALRLRSDYRHAGDAHELAIAAFGAARSAENAAAHASYAETLLAQGKTAAAYERVKRALAIFDQVPKDRAIDPCPALWVFAEAGLRLKKPTTLADARAALGCVAEQPNRKPEVARASLTLAGALGATADAIPLLQVAATDPAVQLPALDALAALRPIDPAAGCAAAIEALVRERTDRREKAARGCKLPRLR